MGQKQNKNIPNSKRGELEAHITNILSFTIPIKAVSKGRPRGGKGRFYTPKKTRDFEKEVREVALFEAMTSDFKKIEKGAVFLKVVFSFKKPTGRRKAERLKYTKPDLTNLCKSIEDALEGIAYRNDSQIAILDLSKIWSPRDMEEHIFIQVGKAVEADE